MAYWSSYPKSGPRKPAKDGIAAKNKRGSIGDTWWSKRFVAVLESFTDPSRLTRGRTYARAGQVMALVVTPGAVTAKVQGSRATPYSVKISIAPLTKPQWDAVDEALASRALYMASLLAGEMPKEIESVFQEARQPLFPMSARDITTTCSCPDYANPCKHVAATYYILAERFDEDPFAILAWRGRDRESLMTALRARRTAEVETEPTETEPTETEPAEPLRIDGFFCASAEALSLRFRPDLDAPPDALARRLGPLLSQTRDLAPSIGAHLGGVSRNARARALSD